MINRIIRKIVSKAAVIIFILLLLTQEIDSAQNTSEPLFETQTLYKESVVEHPQGVRNPRIIVALDGTVLAFGAGGLRRSKNGGKTWSNVEPHANGTRQVIDERSGDILSVSLRDDKLWRSRDHGKTWIEETIKVIPNETMKQAGDAAKLPGSVHFGGCESGIMISHRDGDVYGRLLMPARYQPYGSNDREYWGANYNTAVYSDDGGRTWQVSAFFPEGWTGEGTLTELSDGRVYYNSRTHNPYTERRRVAWSYDSGETWKDFEVLPLYDGGGYGRGYGCNAGLVKVSSDNRDVLLFSQPDTQAGDRYRMTVWASFDGGITWPLKRIVYEGPSAYSSLASGWKGTPSEGMIYLLFEGGPDGRYSAIQCARFNLAWLLEGEPAVNSTIP